MPQINCTNPNCGQALAGGLDTFGHVRWPYCISCFLDPNIFVVEDEIDFFPENEIDLFFGYDLWNAGIGCV